MVFPNLFGKTYKDLVYSKQTYPANAQLPQIWSSETASADEQQLR